MGGLRNKLVAVGLMGGVLISLSAKAQDESHLQERQRLLSIIQAVESDPEKKAAAIRKGHARISFCSHCHGDDGNSKRPDIPNLAGQNPAYMLEQLDMFAQGQRKNLVMQTLAKQFTMDDKVNVSIYFANQEVVNNEEIEPLYARQGKELFTTMCQFCHGADGKGEAGYARLAGQKKAFVITTLKRYRANAKAKPDPNEVKRTNPRMEQVTQHLSDEDIRALANYIASLD